MTVRCYKNRLFFAWVLGFSLLLPLPGKAQFLMDMLDTSRETEQSFLGIHKNFNHLRISGYIQPQFQIAGSKGINSFEGTDFAPNVNNRFMLRRSRVRIDYVHFGKGQEPGVQIAFQFDVNERGFTIRDVWGRVFENKWERFSYTMGMFARPFGYEVNLSSSDRETPERGRMSQIIMKSERDLGAMLTMDARNKKARFKYLKLDAGIFNGQGINATGDFDNAKDFIARASLKPFPLHSKLILSAGVSYLRGALLQNTRYKYETKEVAGVKQLIADSTLTNEGRYAPRQYYGADVDLKLSNGPQKGFTEVRGEFIMGTQTGTLMSSETPVALVAGNNGFAIRQFNGAYFYFLQNLFSEKRQLLLKYDWYDPNTRVKRTEIGAPGSGFTAADIKYTTLGMGYLQHINENVKLLLYYARVWNEPTLLPGYITDSKDDVLTFRVQFRF